MKTTYSRLCQYGSVMFNSTLALLFCIFALSYLCPFPQAQASIKVSRFERRAEFSYASFELAVNLSPQFPFNTQQIFLYITCNTPGREEMVWSKIVQKGDRYNLDGIANSTYSFKATKTGPVIFELRGNVFPYVGKMRDVSYGSITVN